MPTRNGQKRLLKIPGSELLTDEVGIERMEHLKQQYADCQDARYRSLRMKVFTEYLQGLRKERRLYRANGDPV